ncbi:MAG: hypothetical protein ABH850_02165 [Candidatus Micrarchaeota archaeon]
MTLDQKIIAGYAKLAKKRQAWKNKLKVKQLQTGLKSKVKSLKWKNKWDRRIAKMLVRETKWKTKWKMKSIAMDAKAEKWKNKWVNRAKCFEGKALRWRVKWLKRTAKWKVKWWARSKKYPDIFESDYLRIRELEPLPEYI